MAPAKRKIDTDGDGVLSEQEVASANAASNIDKQDSQRQMAWIALIAMLVFTALVFLPIFPDSRIKALADLFSLLHRHGGVVSAYFGAAAFIAKRNNRGSASHRRTLLRTFLNAFLNREGILRFTPISPHSPVDVVAIDNKGKTYLFDSKKRLEELIRVGKIATAFTV